MEIYHFDSEHYHQAYILNPEAVVCSHFGCGVHLAPWMQLFGDRCPLHNIKTDPYATINNHAQQIMGSGTSTAIKESLQKEIANSRNIKTAKKNSRVHTVKSPRTADIKTKGKGLVKRRG